MVALWMQLWLDSMLHLVSVTFFHETLYRSEGNLLYLMRERKTSCSNPYASLEGSRRQKLNSGFQNRRIKLLLEQRDPTQ